jgi:hypothetical protein
LCELGWDMPESNRDVTSTMSTSNGAAYLTSLT